MQPGKGQRVIENGIMKTITAADANRQFSSVLRRVSQGEAFVVTSRGKSVATIAPVRPAGAWSRGARRSLFQRLQSQPVTGPVAWSREELYEET